LYKSRYVDTSRHQEVMSVAEALAQLRETEQRGAGALEKVHGLLAELGYGR
jgi:hypothetical protein